MIDNFEFWEYEVIEKALREKLDRLLSTKLGQKEYNFFKSNRYSIAGAVCLTLEHLNKVRSSHSDEIKSALTKVIKR